MERCKARGGGEFAVTAEQVERRESAARGFCNFHEVPDTGAGA